MRNLRRCRTGNVRAASPRLKDRVTIMAKPEMIKAAREFAENRAEEGLGLVNLMAEFADQHTADVRREAMVECARKVCGECFEGSDPNLLPDGVYFHADWGSCPASEIHVAIAALDRQTSAL